MSLKDQIERQEERRRELEANLNALAAEFVEQMQAFGKEPMTVMDATGQYDFSPGGAYGEDTDIIEYRPTPVQAWDLIVRGAIPDNVAVLPLRRTGSFCLPRPMACTSQALESRVATVVLKAGILSMPTRRRTLRSE
jgi:hypothetical protein